MENHVLSGIMGLAVADALGVPVEFMERESLRKDPVLHMRSYGTYNQPKGTWSDDTSMTLCLVDSLSEGLDYNDIMEKFLDWFNKGKYTAFDEVFDIGIGTEKALSRFEKGAPPLECGGKTERDNGNGSLMRILPILYYIQATYGVEFNKDEEEIYEIIHNVSSLTHGHKRSQIACGIYISIAANLFGTRNLDTAIKSGIYNAMEYYKNQDSFLVELEHFNRLEEEDFKDISIDEISSSGYVVSSLEAAIWCLLNTGNYKDCVLKAVNLGQDTDTIAAIAGGLAGLYYGYDQIPEEWLESLVKKEYIENLCNKLNSRMNRKSIEKLTTYIPYFEDATEESVCKWSKSEKVGDNTYTMSYPIYEDTLIEFIDEFHKTNLMIYNYLDTINKRGINGMDEMAESIADGDIELIRAILTGYVRQERFGDGLWADAVRDKVFLKILKRLDEIIE